MKPILSLVFIYLVSLTSGLYAAEQKSAIKPIRMELSAKAVELPVLSTSKPKNAPRASHDAAMGSIRNIKAVAPAPPDPLPTAQLQALTKSGSPSAGANQKLKAPAKSVLTHLKLSPRNNYHGLGYLELNEVRHVFSKLDAASFYGATSNFMAFVQAHVKVEKGERYLVDWSVSAPKETEFTVGAGGSQTFNVGKGEHHLLMYLDSDVDDWTLLSLFSNTADYAFYSVEVTKVQ